ncbi:hypothetical protein MMYC01_205766 [Madurella mycetomatis]|uniref:Uncharacterized protein n=1 Tax=Madurella mycetomatis TaxID=100816 RepID=A0A175W1D1_9PEZI|nr:hypothetical protein MMYC01_205766 [Madurella mycetomatis]
MPYFDSITSTSAYEAKYSSSLPINEYQQIPAASRWSTDELAGARVVIRAARQDKRCNHMLPALREYLNEEIHSQQQIRELLEGPNLAEYHTLTKSELVHQYGPSLGTCWAALGKFDDIFVGMINDKDEIASIEGDESNAQKRPYIPGDSPHIPDEIASIEGDESNAQKRPYIPGDSPPIPDEITSIENDERDARKRSYTPGSENEPILPVASAKRVRKELHRPGFVSSETMKVDSSPPTKSSEQNSQVSSVGHEDEGCTSADTLEEATVQIISSFICHVLQACPPQNDTMRHRPEFLVEFSDVTRQLAGYVTKGRQIHATAEGELVLYKLDNGNYKLTSYRPALLVAKKCFNTIDDGRPVMTDQVLGQITGEALALRFQLKQENILDEE